MHGSSLGEVEDDFSFARGKPLAIGKRVALECENIEGFRARGRFRYNELCRKGHDDDFGKMAERMFPVENPPYYACSFTVGGMLYIFGGLECDLDMHVLDDDDVPIEGLYVAGNSMGRRFLVEKPVVVAGLSLATATSFGRLAGANAAKGV